MGKKPPAPDPERVAIPMDRALIERIDEYRWSERVPSRAAAIRALIEEGLRQRRKRSPKPEPSDD